MNNNIELFDLDQIKKAILEYNIFSLLDPDITIRILSGIRKNGTFQDDTIQYSYCIFEPVCHLLNSFGYKKYSKLMIKDKLDLEFHKEFINDVKTLFLILDNNSMEWDDLKKGELKSLSYRENDFMKKLIKSNNISDFDELYLFMTDKDNKEQIENYASEHMLLVLDVMKLTIFVSRKQRTFNIGKEFVRQTKEYLSRRSVEGV